MKYIYNLKYEYTSVLIHCLLLGAHSTRYFGVFWLLFWPFSGDDRLFSGLPAAVIDVLPNEVFESEVLPNEVFESEALPSELRDDGEMVWFVLRLSKLLKKFCSTPSPALFELSIGDTVLAVRLSYVL